MFAQVSDNRLWGKGSATKEGSMAEFKERRDAGRKLANQLTAYAGRSDVTIN